ncbi:MAG: methylenetetrahydrofolate reductase [NAD(P)H] [Butyrivibrio sp.]|nr:methylenetetrahydrofolate reductase [NAD(P)H] [Muribaculum sp.]MCM1553667.1 methylenetetrahydrofolate reductase [NAD(P)H] [Butyrivibrio sp.]
MSNTTHYHQTLSFEVFPPKKDDEFDSAKEVLNKLSALNPAFISVTYGAGGSRSKKTIDIASYIQNDLHVPALAHMTCVGSKKEDLLRNYEAMKTANVSRVLALRGDRPRDMTDEQYESRDFAHASDMIAFLKEHTDLQIAGACYPEKHPESFSLEADLQYLKQKQNAGAEFFITQMFFDNDFFYTFRDRALQKGITLPIHAGIMPITTVNQIGTTISLSGSSVPKALADIIAKYSDNAEDMRKAGIDYCIRQILDLKQIGVDGIHIYSMNKPKTTAEIVNAIQ